MDVFKFINPAHPTRLDQGELINGLKSKLWVERYRDISDFEFIADAEAMVHKKLPIGSLISHTDSTEVMIVENHEIREDSGKETEVKITGRSFEAFLENRIIGSNKNWPTTASATEEYVLAANTTWDQAVVMLRRHIDPSLVIDPKDAIFHVLAVTNVSGAGVSEMRSIKRGALYSRLIELLDIDNLGVKTIRPGFQSPLGVTSQNMALLIHKGSDLSNKLAFSYTTGEIESADYLWSNKKLKNAALITGRWIETVIKPASEGYARRWMFIEASDIDSAYSSAPTGTDRDNVIAAMQARGRAELAAQKDVALVKTEATRGSTKYKFRKDYDLGDIVTVYGEYQETAKMQISEYVEVEDETGESNYPTFSSLNTSQ